MICPKCKDLGIKSTVTQGSTYTTAMYCPPYYDEEGKFHIHDRNHKNTQFYCSMGHKISVVLSNKCMNCDFGYEQTVTVSDTPLPSCVTIFSDPSGLSGIIKFKENK